MLVQAFINITFVYLYTDVVGKKMDEVLGNFSVELDGRFSSIRTSETNLGNFICDIMMAACNGDVALLNSGTLRSDRIHPRGDFKMRDLMTILPMLDPLLVLEITGNPVITDVASKHGTIVNIGMTAYLSYNCPMFSFNYDHIHCFADYIFFTCHPLKELGFECVILPLEVDLMII